MQNTEVKTPEATGQLYNYAAHLLVNENKNAFLVKEDLMSKGMDEKSATMMIETLQQQIKDAQNERARKDMIYGALWCVGGTVLTIADLGFIFWGAIVFGAIQFIKGAVNFKND
jgi:hypothetical protein